MTFDIAPQKEDTGFDIDTSQQASPSPIVPKNASSLATVLSYGQGGDEATYARHKRNLDLGLTRESYVEAAQQVVEGDKTDLRYEWQRQAAMGSVEAAMAAAQGLAELEAMDVRNNTELTNLTMVSVSAADTMVSENERATLNNNVNTLATRSGEIARNVSLAEFLKSKEAEEFEAYSFGGLAGSLLLEMVPTVSVGQMLLGVPKAIREAGLGDVQFSTPGDMARHVRGYLATLSDEEAIQVVDRLVEEIDNITESFPFDGQLQNWVWKTLLLYGDEGDLDLEDFFLGVGGAVDAVGFGSVGRGIYRSIKLENRIARATAELRGAEAVGADAFRVLEGGASSLNQTVVDALRNSMSLDLNNILPGTIRGASSEVQARLSQQAEELISSLQQLVKSTRTDDEVKDAFARLLKQYDPAVNRAVHNVGLVDSSGRLQVTWKSSSGVPFATREGAEAYAKGKGFTDFEIVPAKGSGAWVVKDSALDAWRTERATLMSEVGAAMGAVVPPRRVAGKPHIVLKNKADEIKSNLDGFTPEQLFEDVARFYVDAEQAVKQFSKQVKKVSDETLKGEMLGEAAALKHSLKEIARLLDDVELYGQPLTREIAEELSEHMDYIAGVTNLRFDDIGDMPPLLEMGGRSMGAITASKEISEEGLTLAARIAEDLGIEGELVILTRAEVKAGKSAEARAVFSAMDTKHFGSDGLFFAPGVASLDGKSYIVLAKGGKGVDDLRVLVHELGHWYDNRIFKQLDLTERTKLANDFKKWAKASGRKDSLTKFADYFRKFTSTAKDEEGILEAYHLMLRHPDYNKWLGDFSEYFAENFAKALLGGEVGEVGTFFSRLVEGWRALYASATRTLGLKFGDADSNILAHLKARAAQVKAGTAPSVEGSAMTDALGLSPKHMMADSVDDKMRRVAELDSLISAGEETKKGVSSGFLIRERMPIDLDLANVRFGGEDMDSMYWLGVDPKHTASELLVQQRHIGINTEARIAKLFGDFIQPVWRKLSKKEKLEVQRLLQKGNDYSRAGGVGKEFTPSEILGELGKTSSKSAAKITEGYYAFRTLRNAMHGIRDQTMARSLRSQGYERISIQLGEESFVSAGKEIDKTTLVGKRVYDVEKGHFVMLTDDIVADTRRVVVETMERANTAQGEVGKFLVTPDQYKKSRINSVVPYRPGEFSRIYTDEYFIDVLMTKTVDGAQETAPVTFRTASSAKEAEEYIGGMNTLLRMVKAGEDVNAAVVERLVGKWEDTETVLSNIRAGRWDGYVEFPKVRYTRTQDDFTDNHTRMSTGKMFVDKRGDEIVSISKGEPLPPIDAMQAEMTNVSRVASITEWRDTAIHRWFNTFKDSPLVREFAHLDPVEAFYKAGDKMSTSGDNHSKFAERSHKYIQLQLGVKTKEERIYEGLTRAFSEKFLSGPLEPVGHLLRTASAIQFARTFNFHTMLGLGNIAQLYVQSAGAVAAVALHPIYGLKAMKAAAIMRVALASDNPEVWRIAASVEKWSSMGFSNMDDFVESLKAVRKSGLLDGVKSTSLYNVQDGRFNVFGGMGSKVLEYGTIPFNRGEEYARLVSFLVAKQEWQAANKGRKFTDTAVVELMSRTDDLTQNMARNNKAFFQTGVLSIPTQFMQYHIKLAANMLSAFGKSKGAKTRGFTRKEATSILTGHLLLFGLHGNGLNVVGEMIDEETKEAMGPVLRHTMNEGIIAGAIAAMAALYDEEAYPSVGSRIGAFSLYKDIVDSIIEDGGGAFTDVMAGVSKASIDRLRKSGVVFGLWATVPPESPEEVMRALHDLTTIWLSSYKNIHAGWYAYNNQGVFNNQGEKIADASAFEALALSVGMQNAGTTDFYNLRASTPAWNRNLDNVAKEINALKLDSVRAAKREDWGRVERVERAIQTLWPKDFDDQDYVRGKMRDRLRGFDNLLEKELYEQLEMSVSGKPMPNTTHRKP